MAYLLEISVSTLETVTCDRFEGGKKPILGPLYRKDIVPPPYIGWAENGVPRLDHCERLPDQFLRFVANPLPIQIEATQAVPDLPDFWGTEAFNVVTKPFKDIIESIEPNIHQFIRVEIIDRKMRSKMYIHQEFYVFNILTLIKPHELISARDHRHHLSVDRRESKQRTTISIMYRMPFEEIIVNALAIRGLHVWRTRSCIEEEDYDRPIVHFHGAPSKIMVSNECGTRLKDAELTGFDLSMLKETNDL